MPVQVDLATLLELWRERRDPALVPLITKLGAKVAIDETKQLGGLKPTALGDAILSALGNVTPEKLHAFLPVIERFVRTGRGSWPVVELLAELPPDPRIARLALALLRDFDDLSHSSTKLWRRLIDLVETHGDPEAGAMLGWAPALGKMGPTVRPRLDNVTKRLAKSKALSNDELTEIERTIDAFVPGAPRHVASQHASTGEELLAEIQRNPNDDDARLVYADWLSSWNDPRGEFIVLQFQRAEGKSTPAGEKRESALLKKHFREWAGPLRPLLTPAARHGDDPVRREELAVPLPGYERTTFAKGFLASLNPFELPRHRRAVLDDPIWSTIRELAFAPAIAPSMRSLESIERCFPPLLPDLAKLHRPLEHVYVYATAYGNTAPPEVLEPFAVKRMTIWIQNRLERVSTWMRAMLSANPSLESIRFEGSSFQTYGDDDCWPALESAPPAFTSFELDFAPQERVGLRRVDGKWDALSVSPLSLARPADEWRRIFAPFTRRRLTSAFVQVPKRGFNGRESFEALLKELARDVELRPQESG